MRPRAAHLPLALALTVVLGGCCMPPAVSLGVGSPATPAASSTVTSAGAPPGTP